MLSVNASCQPKDNYPFQWQRQSPDHERLTTGMMLSGGESRSGKKIRRRKACRFESGLGHQLYDAVIPHPLMAEWAQAYRVSARSEEASICLRSPSAKRYGRPAGLVSLMAASCGKSNISSPMESCRDALQRHALLRHSPALSQERVPKIR